MNTRALATTNMFLEIKDKIHFIKTNRFSKLQKDYIRSIVYVKKTAVHSRFIKSLLQVQEILSFIGVNTFGTP